MPAMAARGLLTSGLGEIPESAQADLLGMTGRWPVLLGLINGAARVDVRNGAEPFPALLRIRDSLRDSGLTALDAAIRTAVPTRSPRPWTSASTVSPRTSVDASTSSRSSWRTSRCQCPWSRATGLARET